MSHNRRDFCYCLGKNKGKRKRADKLCACVSETILYFLYLTVWKTESDSSYQTWQQCVHVLSLITQFSSRDAGMRQEQERHGSSKNHSYEPASSSSCVHTSLCSQCAGGGGGNSFNSLTYFLRQAAVLRSLCRCSCSPRRGD